MEIRTLPQLLALLAWLSIFVEVWLLILRKIPSDALSWAFFSFFMLLAIIASALATSNPKGLE